MAFNFTTTSAYIEKSPLEDKTDLLNGLCEAQEAYNTLLQANVELDATEAMLVDIQSALAAISEPCVGPESLEMFGTAESFQALYSKPIEDLSRAEAIEGLGDALKAVWNKLVNWLKDIFEAIFKFIKSLLFLGPRTSKKADKVIEACKEPEAKEALKEKEVPPEVMTPDQAAETAKIATETQAQMAEQVQAQAEIEAGVTKASELMKQGKEDEANKLLEELAAKVEEQGKKLDATSAKVDELNKKVEEGKKDTLAGKGWSPESVAKASGEIKKTATADAQKLAKDAEALRARNEKIRRYILNTVITLACPMAGAAKIGYDAYKSANDKHKAEHGGESLMTAGRKKFGDLCRRLASSTARVPGKLCGLFSKLRKKQEKTLDSFETVMTPVTKDEIDAADAHNTNEALKKKQEEMGLETENLQITLEGFMDFVKKVASKIKSNFAYTLKKITDITTRGFNAAKTSDWDHVCGGSNPFCDDSTRLLTYSQAMDLIDKTVPKIIEISKRVVPVYRKTKTVADLPTPEEITALTDKITECLDYSKCNGLQYGPNLSGNAGCGWNASNTKNFVGKYITLVMNGLPKEVVDIAGTENPIDTSEEVTKSIGEARWFIKAYGKCLAEASRTILALSRTCGTRDDGQANR